MEPIDDFVCTHIGEFDGKKLVSADRADLKLPDLRDKEEKEAEDKTHLESPVADSLTKWMKEVLGDKVKEVIVSSRLEDSPAIVVNPDGMFTSSMERVMRATNQEHIIRGKNLEINTSHPLIMGLADMRVDDEAFAKNVVGQIFDNAMIQAGLMIEPRSMVERSYQILERAIKK
jgi:molecular chaperone HtpG